MYKIQGWVEQGNTLISTGGLLSTTKAQGSFPSTTVTVYNHGTVVLASLYSDDNASPTPLANPFTASADGAFGFYAATGRFDIVFSGGALSAPYTLLDVTNGAGGGSGDVVGPGSAVAGNFAFFDGATGKIIFDSGVSPSSFVRGPGSAIGNNIVVFDSTSGSRIKDSGVPISSVTGVTALFPAICQGRLTLAPGFAVYAPQPATPSSTNTGTDIVTFAADPGWPTGTIVTPLTTGAGLTAGTLYYFGRLSSVTGAFYASLANANANTSKVDLTSNVTQQILVSGITQTSLNFTPYSGNAISLYSSGAWVLRTFSETSIAIGTRTLNVGVDVFCYDNAGTPAFELLEWTSATARATAVVLQDGVYVKSGDATRRLIGSFYTDTTTTTISDGGGLATQVGGKRFVWNNYNRKQESCRTKDLTSSWNYSTATWRQANGATGNKSEFFYGLNEDLVISKLRGSHSASGANAEGGVSIGIDSITVPDVLATIALNTAPGATGIKEIPADLERKVPVGYHYASWLERGNGTATATFYGYDSTSNNRLTGLFLTTWQ